MALGCAICIGICAAAASRSARASDDYDCSGVAKWSSSHGHYDKNAVVTYKIHESDAHYHAFKCTDGYCAVEPTHSLGWQDQGACKYSTDPH
jgi:hypothetical protein